MKRCGKHKCRKTKIANIIMTKKTNISKRKKFSRFSCQDTQNNVERPGKCFRKNVRMDVCMCVCGLKLRKIQDSVSQEPLGRSS